MNTRKWFTEEVDRNEGGGIVPLRAIDLFAGAGGFTEGARMAGVKVIWAANHWPAAVEAHARNHPETIHVTQDLHQADYGSETGGRSLDRPIGTLTTRDRYALIDGDRMRMLTVEEQKLAQGFRRDYWLPPQHKLATFMIGNAVSPIVARDLIRELIRAA